MREQVVDGRMTEKDRQFLKDATERQVVKSKLSCFNGTMGIRPGEVSIILGPKGNGKSALCKTISLDCMVSKAKCLHILSEETCEVYKSSIANIAEKANPDRADERLSYSYYDSMLNWDDQYLSFSGFMLRLQQLINEFLPDVVIFDNFSTSFFGSLPVNKQADAVNILRRIANEADVCMVLVSHTTKGSDIYRQAITGEDIRGNANSTNTGSYNYVLSTFFRCDPPRAFLFIDKARYHGNMNQTYWELLFDKETGVYISDRKSSYEELKEVMTENSQAVSMQKTIEKLVEKKLASIASKEW